MNRYILIRRLYGPAILLLLGILALLNQAGVASWNLFVPLLLILLGVIKLAERAALASDPYYGMPYGGAVNPAAAPGTQPYPGQTPGPTPPQDFGSGPNGGTL